MPIHSTHFQACSYIALNQHQTTLPTDFLTTTTIGNNIHGKKPVIRSERLPVGYVRWDWIPNSDVQSSPTHVSNGF